MKSIYKKHINFGIIFVVLSVITFVIGIIKWPFFIISVVFISSYIVLDKKALRCPNCGGFENLERLSIAKKQDYYCRHCGKKIEVQ